MDTLLFLLFCLAIGYVIVWVVINERRGNKNGEWGIIAMLVAPEDPKRPSGGGPSGRRDALEMNDQRDDGRSARPR